MYVSMQVSKRPRASRRLRGTDNLGPGPSTVSISFAVPDPVADVCVKWGLITNSCPSNLEAVVEDGVAGSIAVLAKDMKDRVKAITVVILCVLKVETDGASWED